MIQPKNDRILVRMMPDSPSSIIEVAKDRNSRLLKGEVLAVGPKVTSEIFAGECVVFTQACVDLKVIQGERDLLLIRDGDLAGIVPADVRVTDGRSADL